MKAAKRKTSAQHKPDAISIESANIHKSPFSINRRKSTQARAKDEPLVLP